MVLLFMKLNESKQRKNGSFEFFRRVTVCERCFKKNHPDEYAERERDGKKRIEQRKMTTMLYDTLSSFDLKMTPIYQKKKEFGWNI